MTKDDAEDAIDELDKRKYMKEYLYMTCRKLCRDEDQDKDP